MQIVAGDAVCLQVEDSQCPVSGCLDFSWTSSMLHILLETAQLPGPVTMVGAEDISE